MVSLKRHAVASMRRVVSLRELLRGIMVSLTTEARHIATTKEWKEQRGQGT